MVAITILYNEWKCSNFVSWWITNSQYIAELETDVQRCSLYFQQNNSNLVFRWILNLSIYTYISEPKFKLYTSILLEWWLLRTNGNEWKIEQSSLQMDSIFTHIYVYVN